jgi:lysophospholipase L1-like esterase
MRFSLPRLLVYLAAGIGGLTGSIAWSASWQKNLWFTPLSAQSVQTADVSGMELLWAGQAKPQVHTDILPKLQSWQTLVKQQATVVKNHRYQGCLFGDSISKGLQDRLGPERFNFAMSGMSTVSLVEQLNRLRKSGVQCKIAIVAIGTNDAWYTMTNQQFSQNITQTITLLQSFKPKQIVLIPAFYSTVAASQDPETAGPIARVDEINQLMKQAIQSSKSQQPSVKIVDVKPLFADKALKSTLTFDGVHLNPDGLAIYQQTLEQILQNRQ